MVSDAVSKMDEVLNILKLEKIEKNMFRGQNEPRPMGMRLFGGQVLSQALAAAANTVEPSRDIHSLHGYFLRPGQYDVPVLYKVDRIRDGKSFTTRRIVAVQNGEAIFNMAVSFHHAEDGFEHTSDMPEVPPPEELEDDRIVYARMAEEHGFKNPWSTRERAFDMRSTIPVDQIKPGEKTNPQWIRFRARLPDDQRTHSYLLAYASDMGFVGTAMTPHRKNVMRDNMQVASLDHALWFHRPFRVDEWILYYKSTPSAAGARGFNQGTFYSASGEVVASAMQEGLIRLR